MPPENNRVERNVCVGKWLEAGWRAGPEMLRLQDNLTNAESSLASCPNDQSPAADFELKPDSPAFRLGFQRIPLAQIGFHQDDARRGLKLLAAQQSSTAGSSAPR